MLQMKEELFKETRNQNILTSAMKSNIKENPTAAVAEWEYYNLKRSYDTLQSVQTDKLEVHFSCVFIHMIYLP